MVTTSEIKDLNTSEILPLFGLNDLAQLGVNGVAGLGVIAFIFDHRGRLLMPEHAAGQNREEQLLGPVSEKSKYYSHVTQSGIICPTLVESAATTLRRGLEEELGIGNTSVDFEMLDPAFFMSERQLHDDDPLKRRARAVVAVMRTLDPKLLTASYLSGSDEIVSADFYNFEDLLNMPQIAFRPGTTNFMRQIASNPLYDPFITGSRTGQPGNVYRLGSSAIGTSGLVGFDVDFTQEAA